MQKVYTKIESIVGNVVTVRADGVRNGDLALVGDSYANVIKLDRDLVTLQVFSGTQGVSTTDPVRFLGRPMMVSFSDHLLEKTPQMTRDKPAITPEQAKAIASRVTDRPLPQLRREDSVLPCYVLHDGKNNSVAITRQGGFLCYLVTAKPEALTARLSYQQAVDKAQQFLQAQGYSSMKDTYYETTDGVMTLNFAYLDPATQTICYTDLIKVEISLQDGSVLGLDARGYLVNHHQRQLPSPQLSPEQAQQMLSPLLTVDSVRPALIPTSGKNEAAVYEFFCTSSTGDRVLCYINTATGAEEQLLLLVQTPNGTLTK